jgi:regulator of protease activity HflC (stomatin/prohibitin superfamily)
VSDRGFSRRIEDWWVKARFYIYLAGLVILLCIGFFWDRMVITIQAGNHGVRYRRLAHGTVTDKVWGEGTYFIPPWDTLTAYETRLQERTVGFPTLTKDGLEIALTVSIRFYPLTANLGFLHREVGPDYFKRLIQPAVEAFLRRVIGEHRAEEIYASEGSFLNEATHLTLTVKDAMVPYVHIDAVLIRELHLPEIVRRAINEKHQAEQLVLSYNFRIQTEEKEAERKRIEASGIHDYNIIAGNISPDLLRWRGIEATLSLAQSSNAKVVVIGGKDGMPIILDTNTAIGSAAAPATPPTTLNAATARVPSDQLAPLPPPAPLAPVIAPPNAADPASPPPASIAPTAVPAGTGPAPNVPPPVNPGPLSPPPPAPASPSPPTPRIQPTPGPPTP